MLVSTGKQTLRCFQAPHFRITALVSLRTPNRFFQSCSLSLRSPFSRSYHHQHSHHSKSDWQKRFSNVLLFASPIALSGAAAWYYLRDAHPLEQGTEISAEPQTTDEFTSPTLLEPVEAAHPYDSSSWYFKMYFTTTRLMYLSFLFVPCITVAAIAHVTNSEALRQYSLDVLVRTFEAAGCSFQKLGQWLAMRPDMFPADICEALSKLHNDAPSHEFSYTRDMVKESFGVELEEIFEVFDQSPVASGTVGQVHRAVLTDEYARKAGMLDRDGNLVKHVAVKVRHPKVVPESWKDLDIIFSIMNATKVMALPMSQDEFCATLQRQINFKYEAANLLRFKNNFQEEIKTGILQFPQVVTSLCSSCVLVESWEGGQIVKDIFSEVGEGFQELKSAFSSEVAAKKKVLARNVFDMTIKMFLRDNLAHGDLHGGNVMFDPVGLTCTILDAGITSSVEQDAQSSFGLFLYSLCSGNVDGMMSSVYQFGTTGDSSGGMASIEVQQGVRRDLEVGVKKWYGDVDSLVSLGDMAGHILYALRRHGVELRSDISSALASMSIAEGLIRSLDPDFDMVTNAMPYFLRYRDSNIVRGARGTSSTA